MKRAVAALLFAAAGLSAAAKTYYVDCSLGDDTGHDGRSCENAFERLSPAACIFIR